jgi:hypothetical protein
MVSLVAQCEIRRQESVARQRPKPTDAQVRTVMLCILTDRPSAARFSNSPVVVARTH